ncbi:MAG: cupin domain-containing protein [Lachnospiraceae bacterium]|nr:cupin domain-containing protein [Lachnospiraceae bacterium]MBR4058822.1 cupin domain-containing protein [Lachnospiraceae bacterium]
MVIEGKSKKTGFSLVCKNDDYKCAFITYSPQYKYGKVTELKRHRESDEVFVLISGKGTLLTMESECGEYETAELQKGISYCVPAGTWHYLAVTEETLVFVVENTAVSAENTDVVSIEEDKAIEILCEE